MNNISIIIISKNEEKRIENALKSVQWADELVIVDSGSSDKTIEIVKRFTDKIYFRKFDDFSSQKNFALSKCNNDWILALDCDEVVTDELKNSIISTLNSGENLAAYKVRRINKLFGRVLTHAAGNDFPIRLFKRSNAKFVQTIHEFLQVEGKIGTLAGDLLHNTTATIKSEFEKTDRYTELEARWLLKRNIRVTIFKTIFYPILVFLYIYIFKKGILDGRAGLIYAFVSARYSFVKYRKAYRLSKDIKYLEHRISERFSQISNQFPDTINDNDSRLNCLLRSFSELKNKHVLEIGCGKGRFTRVIKDNGANCFGVDVSENFIREALKKNKGIFLISSATNLAFKSEVFDAAFAVEVIEHLPALESCIKEAARVLKPGGRFIIIDRNILSINNRRWFVPNAIIKKYHEIKNDWMYPKGFPYVERWFLNGAVKKLLKSYFNNVESSYVISDSEKKSAISYLFKSIPVARHFILWKATEPKT